MFNDVLFLRVTCIIRFSFAVSPFDVFINSTDSIYEEGDTVYLLCMHSGGPNNTYSWQINGRELSESSQILTHTIALADEDGGSYNCIVNNPAGHSSGNIIIYTVPTVFVQPQDTFSLVGGVAEFTCGARGFPRPMYTAWIKTEGNVTNTSIFSIDEDGLFVLTIPHVVPEDQGEYVCVVSGSVLTTSNPAELTG